MNSPSAPESSETLWKLVLKVGRLKLFPRTGWLTRGVEKARVESVAEHSFRTAVLAMMLADMLSPQRRVNFALVLRMALLHDFPEILLKDLDKEAWNCLTPSLKAKPKVEKEALRRLLAEVSPPLRKKYEAVWRNYRRGSSLEAQIVEAADRLETAFQAYEYVEGGCPLRLVEEIWEDAQKKVYQTGLAPACALMDRLKENLRLQAKT
ncbi:HD domain-containing protein [Candidatus Hecatella orcuttiae]|jgi:putative hydrolase of HD superfamily|uniref:HD domain-containing protein n=1 Tax=Candidatus Hecatella orcuttiae TaxID=1935119 RepID=UPI002867FA4D|nr:HD domain-containing protein [Candidatus Hecatella orcuttiae]